jgi:hypothetical protein
MQVRGLGPPNYLQVWVQPLHTYPLVIVLRPTPRASCRLARGVGFLSESVVTEQTYLVVALAKLPLSVSVVQDFQTQRALKFLVHYEGAIVARGLEARGRLIAKN